MTGTDLKNFIKTLKLTVPEFSKVYIDLFSKHEPEGINQKKLIRNILSHYERYELKPIPLIHANRYKKTMDACVKMEFASPAKGPNTDLLARMVEVVLRENQNLQKEIARYNDEITEVKRRLSELEKVTSGKLPSQKVKDGVA